MKKDRQARLYFLYMMADGEVSTGERGLFNSICQELNLNSSEKQNAISAIKALSKNGESCIDVVKWNAKNDSVSDYIDIDLHESEPEQGKAAILWNLINLGYADTYFSNEEREVVDFIKNYWEIPESLYQEMIDVSETCLALEKHKKWAENLPESGFRTKKINQIKKDLRDVQETIKTTISEIEC